MCPTQSERVVGYSLFGAGVIVLTACAAGVLWVIIQWTA